MDASWQSVHHESDALVVFERGILENGLPEAQQLGLPVFYSEKKWLEYVYYGGACFSDYDTLKRMLEAWEADPGAFKNCVWPFGWKEECDRLTSALSRI